MEPDVLENLERLQEVADEIDRLESRRQAAREERDRLQEALEGAQGELTRREERAHALDIERRKRELVIKEEKDRMARVKSRMGEVKTSREYQAVIAEIGSAKQNVTENEAVLAQELQDLEALTAQVAEARAQVEALERDLAEAAGVLDAVVAETEQGIADMKDRENRYLAQLPREVVDRYRLIRTRRGGLAVVEARAEACTACNMRIPPQAYIEVIRRTRVVQCPNCHRILVPPREEVPAS